MWRKSVERQFEKRSRISSGKLDGLHAQLVVVHKFRAKNKIKETKK